MIMRATPLSILFDRDIGVKFEVSGKIISEI